MSDADRPVDETTQARDGGVRGHIVIIDDDEAFRDVLRIGLELDGFRVSTAADGPAGLDIVSRSAPDAVILDLHLAEGDGLESLVRLRARGDVGQVPVVVLTAEDGGEHRERGRIMGADRYLTKPVDLEFLVWSLDELLARKRAVRMNPLAGLRHHPTIPPGLVGADRVQQPDRP